MSYFENRAARAKAADKRAWGIGLRILVLIFIVISAVAIPLELRARSAQASTRKAVEAAWEAANARGTLLSKKELLKCLQGSFSREKTAKGERFAWQGVLQAYPMQVEYRAGGMVQRIVWN